MTFETRMRMIKAKNGGDPWPDFSTLEIAWAMSEINEDERDEALQFLEGLTEWVARNLNYGKEVAEKWAKQRCGWATGETSLGFTKKKRELWYGIGCWHPYYDSGRAPDTAEDRMEAAEQDRLREIIKEEEEKKEKAIALAKSAVAKAKSRRKTKK